MQWTRISVMLMNSVIDLLNNVMSPFITCLMSLYKNHSIWSLYLLPIHFIDHNRTAKYCYITQGFGIIYQGVKMFSTILMLSAPINKM